MPFGITFENRHFKVFYKDRANWLPITSSSNSPQVIVKLRKVFCRATDDQLKIATKTRLIWTFARHELNLLVRRLGVGGEGANKVQEWNGAVTAHVEFMDSFYYAFNLNFFMDFGLIYGHSWYYIYRLFYEKIGVFWKYDKPENYPILEGKNTLF